MLTDKFNQARVADLHMAMTGRVGRSASAVPGRVPRSAGGMPVPRVATQTPRPET